MRPGVVKRINSAFEQGLLLAIARAVAFGKLDGVMGNQAAEAGNAGITVWALSYDYSMGQAIVACAPDRVMPDFRA